MRSAQPQAYRVIHDRPRSGVHFCAQVRALGWFL